MMPLCNFIFHFKLFIYSFNKWSVNARTTFIHWVIEERQALTLQSSYSSCRKRHLQYNMVSVNNRIHWRSWQYQGKNFNPTPNNFLKWLFLCDSFAHNSYQWLEVCMYIYRYVICSFTFAELPLNLKIK